MRTLRGLRRYIALSLAWAAVLGAALFIVRRPAAEPIEILPPPTARPTTAPTPTATPGPLRVDVAGAVVSPGVYMLPRGSLVNDAIAAAGGSASGADLDRLNKALPLHDGAQVFVPRVGQSIPTVVNPPATPTPPRSRLTPNPGLQGAIDLNTATLEQLDTLPGIGPATAQRIIEGRPYASIEDLLRVRGIGQATFEKLRDLVVIN
jgi:competence protein ComEA